MSIAFKIREIWKVWSIKVKEINNIAAWSWKLLVVKEGRGGIVEIPVLWGVSDIFSTLFTVHFYLHLKKTQQALLKSTPQSYHMVAICLKVLQKCNFGYFCFICGANKPEVFKVVFLRFDSIILQTSSCCSHIQTMWNTSNNQVCHHITAQRTNKMQIKTKKLKKKKKRMKRASRKPNSEEKRARACAPTHSSC